MDHSDQILIDSRILEVSSPGGAGELGVALDLGFDSLGVQCLNTRNALVNEFVCRLVGPRTKAVLWGGMGGPGWLPHPVVGDVIVVRDIGDDPEFEKRVADTVKILKEIANDPSVKLSTTEAPGGRRITVTLSPVQSVPKETTLLLLYALTTSTQHTYVSWASPAFQPGDVGDFTPLKDWGGGYTSLPRNKKEAWVFVSWDYFLQENPGVRVISPEGTETVGQGTVTLTLWHELAGHALSPSVPSLSQSSLSVTVENLLRKETNQPLRTGTDHGPMGPLFGAKPPALLPFSAFDLAKTVPQLSAWLSTAPRPSPLSSQATSVKCMPSGPIPQQPKSFEMQKTELRLGSGRYNQPSEEERDSVLRFLLGR